MLRMIETRHWVKAMRQSCLTPTMLTYTTYEYDTVLHKYIEDSTWREVLLLQPKLAYRMY